MDEAWSGHGSSASNACGHSRLPYASCGGRRSHCGLATVVGQQAADLDAARGGLVCTYLGFEGLADHARPSTHDP